jgi:hypothetical protein
MKLVVFAAAAMLVGTAVAAIGQTARPGWNEPPRVGGTGASPSAPASLMGAVTEAPLARRR